jgi:hypothetical protein
VTAMIPYRPTRAGEDAYCTHVVIRHIYEGPRPMNGIHTGVVRVVRTLFGTMQIRRARCPASMLGRRRAAREQAYLSQRGYGTRE